MYKNLPPQTMKSRFGLAFLQNMWVKDPIRVKKSIETFGEEYRLRIIEYSLFAGCLTGRRLEEAFGNYIQYITWEESTKEIAGSPKTIFPADRYHIHNSILDYNPRIVLTFGNIAYEAVSKVYKGEIIACPHPAARQSDVKTVLYNAANKFKTLYNNQRLSEIPASDFLVSSGKISKV